MDFQMVAKRDVDEADSKAVNLVFESAAKTGYP